MQPALITEVPVRLDRPDPSRCTECKMPKQAASKSKRRRARRAGS